MQTHRGPRMHARMGESGSLIIRESDHHHIIISLMHQADEQNTYLAAAGLLRFTKHSCSTECKYASST